jgi:tRNA-guanine family transglycosylase|tara:strand:+ start:847 stop:1995 length:1149 start_codon:yes stop_codon:yes gene_type:complete
MKISDYTNLKSKYIPVANLSCEDKGLEFWNEETAYFYYPYKLVNLMQFKSHKSNYGIDDNCFLLCDSGGFQVITGKCDYDWESSIKQQLLIGATRLFAFDTPPITKKHDASNALFVDMAHEKTKEIIKMNIDIALKQSNYLKQNAPDRIKDFFYIMHGGSKELLDYNLEVLDEKIGIENYSKYFGGVCYGAKSPERIMFTTNLLHAREHFIKKGLPVHILGAGAPYKMVLLVRCEMTTFDSGTALSGQTYWAWINHMGTAKSGGLVGSLNTHGWPFDGQFCDCPVCRNVDYNKLLSNEETRKSVGEYIMGHNLYQMVRMTTFLNGLKKDKYTEVIQEFVSLPNDVIQALEYIDLADKEGFEVAYSKYKHFIKKDKSRQESLF